MIEVIKIVEKRSGLCSDWFLFFFNPYSGEEDCIRIAEPAKDVLLNAAPHSIKQSNSFPEMWSYVFLKIKKPC